MPLALLLLSRLTLAANVGDVRGGAGRGLLPHGESQWLCNLGAASDRGLGCRTRAPRAAERRRAHRHGDDNRDAPADGGQVHADLADRSSGRAAHARRRAYQQPGGKFYQPPPLETISGPLLQYAQSSNLGFLPLHGERDEEYQFGLTVPFRGWMLDVFDHNPIGNSSVFLPITISGTLIRATELTLRSPRFWAGEQVYVTYSNQTADGFGTITGGLTDFSPPSGYYALDHDQRNTLNVGVQAELPWRAFASLNLYFGSGFANGNAPPSHLPSNGTLDVSLGKTFVEQLTASLTVLNIADKHLLIDNSLTFDGFHWNYPRQIYAALYYHFGY